MSPSKPLLVHQAVSNHYLELLVKTFIRLLAVVRMFIQIRVTPSFWPSFSPSAWKCSWIGPLIFSEIQHGVRGPCGKICMTMQIFLGENSLWPIMMKNGQKWPKKESFHLFWKILELIFAETYILTYLLTNPIPCKTLVGHLWTKMLLTNQIKGSLKCNISRKR